MNPVFSRADSTLDTEEVANQPFEIAPLIITI